nr:hypothetical protein [uncultured Bacteroides sp.]
MATISYKEIEKELTIFKEKFIAVENVGYILLSAFGMTDTSVERVRSGKMNLAQDNGIYKRANQ